MGRINLKQFQDKSTDSDKSVESEVENSLKIPVVPGSVMEKSEKPSISEKPITSKKPKKVKKSTKAKINVDPVENKKRDDIEGFSPILIPIEIRQGLRKVLRGQYSQYKSKNENRLILIVKLWTFFGLENIPKIPIPEGLRNEEKNELEKV